MTGRTDIAMICPHRVVEDVADVILIMMIGMIEGFGVKNLTGPTAPEAAVEALLDIETEALLRGKAVLSEEQR